MRTQGYYRRRAVVRFVFWTTVFAVAIQTVLIVMTRLTEAYYGIKLP